MDCGKMIFLVLCNYDYSSGITCPLCTRKTLHGYCKTCNICFSYNNHYSHSVNKKMFKGMSQFKGLDSYKRLKPYIKFTFNRLAPLESCPEAGYTMEEFLEEYVGFIS
jgi:hypothetical protein